ncbi:hypothetical protein HU200_043991 [Digitaria exilis]|uniref:DUF4220 domain-containing protein n=1 Tax=Digitaria exilis TaxID=1010633 RepID=A0A835B2F4_9POAL|nr:hypothetical protein HU200_043991 [Digitaria exilis]
MFCYYWCGDTHGRRADDGHYLGLAIIDAVAPCLLIALVMISEHSFQTRKWIGIILRCRWKLMMNHWDEKIGQCSVLMLHQRRTTQFFVPLMRLLCFPERKKKVKIPEAVKICIIRALGSTRNGGLSPGTTSLRQTQAGERLLWACNIKGTSDTILVWHIATCIFEYQQTTCHKQASTSNLDSHYKIAAIHLSRDLCNAVKKDADRVLAGRAAVGSSSTPEDKCRQLVELLGEGSKNEELKNGVKLGKQLIELAQGDEETWKLLAGFWSEMILYVAPSDNLKGHSEAIARGGELITLLWALLFHVGIFSRPDETDGAATSAAGDGV